MLEVTRSLPKIKNVSAFTRRITHNKCVDRVRKKKEIPLTVCTQDEDESTRMLDNLMAPEYLPEKIDDSSVIMYLRSALAGLGHPCTNLLQARYIDELSYDDVAQQARMPAKQIGVRISRCLTQLRKSITADPVVWGELELLMKASA
jgi:RNA polymerase sigma factor (sigma-70 family)